MSSFFSDDAYRWRYDVQYGVAIVRPPFVLHNYVDPPLPPRPRPSPMDAKIQEVASRALGVRKRSGAFRYWLRRFNRLVKIERKLYGGRR